MGGVRPKEALKIIMNDNRFINVCGNHDIIYIIYR